MRVVEEYRSDVFPSSLLEEVVEEEKLPYSIIKEGKPEFPIFMETRGLKLNK